MFALFGTGYLFYKKTWMSEQGCRDMGRILLYLVIPVVIIQSFWIERTEEKTAALLSCIFLSFLAMGISVLFGHLFFRKDGISAFSTSFSNAGFIGIPLVNAAVGKEGAFYVAMMIVMINALQWTAGVYMITEDRSTVSIRNLFLNPIVLSVGLGLVMYFGNVPQPEIMTSLMDAIKGMNTALAMLVSGAYLAKTEIVQMIKRKNTYVVCLVRLLVIPLCILALFTFLPAGNFDIRLAIVIAAACPVGSNVAVFAAQYHKNYTEAVEQVCMSTLFCLFTLPLIVSLATGIL